MEDYNIITGLTGWQIELNAFRSGGGAYWVPDPVFGMTMQQLILGRDKAQSYADSIESRLGDFSSSANTSPMRELILLLSQKVATYNSAISDLQNIPPDPITLPKDEFPVDDTNIPVEPPVEKSNMPLYLIGGGLVLLFLYANSRKKKKVTGKNDDVLPVVLGFGALLLLTKKKETTPVVVVDPGITQEPFAETQSTYTR